MSTRRSANRWTQAPAPPMRRVAKPAPAGPTVRLASRRRLPAKPRPRIVDVLAGLAGLGLGMVIALGVTAESSGSFSAPGGALTAAGRITGLVAMYAMIVVVLLVARIPPLERAVGMDRLIGWHRKLGPWPLYLIVAHGVLTTVGYAQAAHDGVLHEFGQLLWTYPGVLAATVGFMLLIAAGVTSYKKARRRMAYETWWSVHLYTYLALFLSFSHQIGTGASFVGNPAATLFWKTLFWGTAATVVACRIALPVWRSLRHHVKVARVVPAGPGMFTVVLEGRKLHRLPIAGGQFLQWRFLTPGMWWQAHPYSLSAAPDRRHLQITVKALGDHSAALASLPPGTRVAIEGPYGAFTTDHRTSDKVLLIGAGVGTTPIHALLQELPQEADVVAVLRASRAAELALREEIGEELGHRRGAVHELVGSRDGIDLSAAGLLRLVPDLAERDVFICGPDGFTSSVVGAARAAGVPAGQLHHETFDF
ncbi:MAG: ferric reductase [Conexibacter sp.]|nr:ferric reductase [Conexibacter sp.]